MSDILVTQSTPEQQKTQKEIYRFKAVVEQFKDGIVITDSNGCIQYANPAHETISGFSKEEIIGKDCQSLCSNRISAEKSTRKWETVTRQGGWSGHLINRRKNGTSYQEECTIFPIRGERGEIENYVMVKRDITEKKRLESIAETANIMENIGFVFFGIRHELGNPINTIKTTLDVLSTHLDGYSREKIREFIERSIGEVKRVEYLLNALENFSMFEKMHPVTVSPNSLMDALLPLVSKDLEKKSIVVRTEISPMTKAMRTDPQALQHVLRNLIVNAAEALEDTNAPRIRIRFDDIGDHIRIVIQDNGCGIPRERRHKLFTPFFTTKPKGIGLGLVSIRKILLKLGGTIDIESRENFGTCITIVLPGAH